MFLDAQLVNIISNFNLYSNVYTSPEWPSIDAVLHESNGFTVSTLWGAADIHIVVSILASLTVNTEELRCVWRREKVKMKRKVSVKDLPQAPCLID